MLYIMKKYRWITVIVEQIFPEFCKFNESAIFLLPYGDIA